MWGGGGVGCAMTPYSCDTPSAMPQRAVMSKGVRESYSTNVISNDLATESRWHKQPRRRNYM